MENPIDHSFLPSDDRRDGFKVKVENKKLSSKLSIDPCHDYPDEFYENYIVSFQPNRKKRYCYRFLKRSFDIPASLLGLILLSPLFWVVAIAIKIDSRGPVFFKQKRIGRNGKPFSCYKFRSMQTTAPKNRATSDFDNAEQYVTRVGAFLRRYSLDELPQLVCCFVGTMSLIGPRPLIAEEESCNTMRSRLGVFATRPGLSGYAQVNGRDDVKNKNKPIMDAYYVKYASIGMDLKLLFQTVGVVISRRGNDSEKMKKKEQ